MELVFNFGKKTTPKRLAQTGFSLRSSGPYLFRRQEEK